MYFSREDVLILNSSSLWEQFSEPLRTPIRIENAHALGWTSEPSLRTFVDHAAGDV
jgi:hypothetical protein